jgi:hypothetical protein
MEIADHEIAVATRDDIPGIVDLQELRLVFRIEHGCGPPGKNAFDTVSGLFWHDRGC